MMNTIPVPDLEPRLQDRYKLLVEAHQHAASRVAAGMAHLPDTTTSFAATQAAWRFWKNEDVTPAVLVEPLRQAGRDGLVGSPAPCALLVHDWCKLDYASHKSKTDLATLTHQDDIGYDMATALLVSAQDGAPLAPMHVSLETAQQVHSTLREAPPTEVDHLSQVLPVMQASRTWGLPLPLVHIIDREADSVGHYRQWADEGFSFLVRGDDRCVLWEGQPRLLSFITTALQQRGAFGDRREILYHGKKAWQEVAEVPVVLHKPARHYDENGMQHNVPGRPLPLRLIVTEVRDAAGNLLATWWLLTNVPAEWADAATIALWYYWRWRIETYHKLLKSSGMEVEHWQQCSGLAIIKRLLVAAMACVVVWRLQETTTPQAEELKRVLIKLSGRQMKYGRGSTAPALLAGLYTLLAMLSLLEHYDLNELRRLVHDALPYANSG
jgi:Transposase DDE domain